MVFHLLEHRGRGGIARLAAPLGARIAEVCRVDERVTGVTVTVRKLHPPVRAMVDYVAVCIEQ